MNRQITVGRNFAPVVFEWCSSLVVIAKADGRIRLTCNYTRLNEQPIIPVMPLPTVDQILSGLGGAKVFSSMDLVSVFFQCSRHEDSILDEQLCALNKAFMNGW